MKPLTCRFDSNIASAKLNCLNVGLGCDGRSGMQFALYLMVGLIRRAFPVGVSCHLFRYFGDKCENNASSKTNQCRSSTASKYYCSF